MLRIESWNFVWGRLLLVHIVSEFIVTGGIVRANQVWIDVVLNKRDQISHIHMLILHLLAGRRDVVLEDRENDQDCDAGGEATIVENEATVECTCRRTDRGAQESAGDSGAGAVASDNRAHSRCECCSV